MEGLWYLLIGLPLVLLAGRTYVNWGRPKKRIEPKVFQEAMTRRWTEKRKAEEKVEKANWELESARLVASIAIRGLPLEGKYVSSEVLKFLWDNDRPRFDVLMAHNQRLEREHNFYNAESEYYGDY